MAFVDKGLGQREGLTLVADWAETVGGDGKKGGTDHEEGPDGVVEECGGGENEHGKASEGSRL